MTTDTAERLRQAELEAEAAIDALSAARVQWIADATVAAADWTTTQARLYAINQTSVTEALGRESVAAVRSRVEELAEQVQTSLPAELAVTIGEIHEVQGFRHNIYSAVRTVTARAVKKTTTIHLAAILKEAGYSTTSSAFRDEPEWYRPEDVNRSEHSGPPIPTDKHRCIEKLKTAEATRQQVSRLKSELAKENAADLWEG